MEAAPPRTRGRRLRRGTVERPLNARLVRMGFVVVAPAVLAFLFSISTTGTLPRSSLEPLFDGESAAALAGTLDIQYPSRVPGSEGAAEATRWYAQTSGALGLTTVTDTWTEDLADLGSVQLSNVVTTVPGRSDETLVVVAHRDNAGTDQALGNNASGTGALLELARGFAPQDVGPDPLPQHTLVFVSTDAGAYGGAGAAHFVETSPLAGSAIAVVVLDGLGGRGLPRIAIAGDEPVMPARVLVRTAARRVEERVGVAPALPAAPLQLVDLGLPYAAGEQGRFLGRGIAAVTLTTSDPDHPPVPAGDPELDLDTQRLGQLGRSTEALLGSLDVSVGGAFRTPDSLFVGNRAASGWTVRLTLVLLVVPFALGVVDLLVRARRRGLPFRPALRALRARVCLALLGGLLLLIGAMTGVFPTGASLPLAPYADLLDRPPIVGLLLLAAAYAVAWLIARRRLVVVAPPTAEEWLAGLAVALALVGAVAITVALTRPYALVFVVPSLYAWLALPVERRVWQRVVLFVLGLAGPIVALALLSYELGISLPAAVLYTLGLATVGYLPPGTVLLALLWLAAAAQVGALALGRYGPYAGGAEPPPPGPVRLALRRAVKRA
jgi:Peptidase family M28